jgi:hypothetical protein
MLVREPVARLRSWLAHCRRVSHDRYRDMCEGFTDREVIDGTDGYTCRQAHWVARALRDGANYESIPTRDELPALLDRVNVMGPTEEIERVMQLIAYKMGWPAPPRGWHINRRPDAAEKKAADVETDVSDAEILERLAIDTELYRLVAERFWADYAAMLSIIHPGGVQFSADSAREQPIDLTQSWLRDHHERGKIRRYPFAVERFDYSADEAVAGEGWWWREKPGEFGYRWTGPETASSISLPPLVASQPYTLTLDAMGAAAFDLWEGVTIRVNGCPIDVVRERLAGREQGTVTLRLHAIVPPDVVSAQRGETCITIHVPTTKQALAHVNVLESFDTYNRDTRHVGVAVHRIRARKALPQARPILSVRRPARPKAA